MIRLFGNKKKEESAPLPEFWVTYQKQLELPLSQDLEQLRFVVLDTETTGFDYRHDYMLCIGALELKQNAIAVAHSFEVYLEQDHYNPKAAPIHGILRYGKQDRVSEKEALEAFIDYIGNAVLVAHHAYFDLNMINQALSRQGLPPIGNKVLDTEILYRNSLLKTNLLRKKKHYPLDELAEKFGISTKDRHTALGDAYITAIAFLKILGKLQEKNPISLNRLLKYS